MSDLEEALAVLERAVSRLEAAPLSAGRDAVAQLTAEREVESSQLDATAAEIVARVESALAKIGQVLESQAADGEAPEPQVLDGEG